MNARDLEYIENRLLAPCVPAIEAHEKLRNHSGRFRHRYDLANRLMYAMQEFTNTCRDIRRELVEAENDRRVR